MNQTIRSSLAALVCLVAAAPAVAAQAQASSADYPRIDFVEDSLPNGLKVLYHVDHTTPVVGVNIWYNVGSKNEVAGRTGFAHLFEHLMFKGSAHVGDGQHMAMLEAVGGIAGADINGTTEFDRTNYFESVPSNQLELALWMESDRMGTLLDVLTQEKLDNQREVVKNERRQSYDNQPYGAETETLLAAAFPEGHPYHHDVIGSMEDLNAATLDDVKTFFHTYYAPNNAVLVLAGDLDVPQAKELVRKHFGWIRRGPAPLPVTVPALPPTFGGERREVVNDALAPAPAVTVAFRIPDDRSAAAPAAELLTGTLTRGRSSLLYRKLVLEQQVATRVSGYRMELIEGSDLLVLQAYGRPGTDPAALEKALVDAASGAGAEITRDDLDRARAGQRFGFVNGLQSLGGFGGRADRLAEGWTYRRDANAVNGILPAFDRVTLDQLKALAAERLIPANRITIVFIPTPATQAR